MLETALPLVISRKLLTTMLLTYRGWQSTCTIVCTHCKHAGSVYVGHMYLLLKLGAAVQLCWQCLCALARCWLSATVCNTTYSRLLGSHASLKAPLS